MLKRLCIWVRMGRCMGSEVDRRIGMTMQTVRAMKKVYESRDISREAKVTRFEPVVIPTLTWM